MDTVNTVKYNTIEDLTKSNEMISLGKTFNSKWGFTLTITNPAELLMKSFTSVIDFRECEQKLLKWANDEN